MGSSPYGVKPKTMCCFSSEDSIKEKGAKTGWNLLGIRIMCASGLTRLSTD